MNYFIDLSLFKNNRHFSFLFAGQFVSFIGAVITSVALPYQIYQLTASTVMVGLLSLIQLIPLIFTALLGGVYADRYNRRKLVIFSEYCLILSCGMLIFNAELTTPYLFPIFMIASIMSAMTGLHHPAFQGMTQQLITPKHYKALGALFSVKANFCLIIIPAMTGLMISHCGIVFTYAMDFVAFLISLSSLLLMRPIENPTAPIHASIFSSLLQGLQFAYQRQVLIGSYCVDVIAMIFAMPNALFPAIAQSFGGVQILGLLYAAPAVGAILISSFSGWTTNIKHDGKAIAIAALCWGCMMIGFGIASSLWSALCFLVLAGMFDAISGIFRITLWNNTIPHDFRGRLAGIEMISYLSGPRLGDTRAGMMAAYFGITTTIISGGILCVIGVMICCLCMPKFWKYHGHEDITGT